MTLDSSQHPAATEVGRTDGYILGMAFLRLCPQIIMRAAFQDVSFLVPIDQSRETCP